MLSEEIINNILTGYKGTFGIYMSDWNGNKILKNENRKFMSASLIKLFILLALDEDFLSDEIIIDESKKVDGGVLFKLKSKIKLSIEDLAMLMIAYSDNSATNILIDYLGMDRINTVIKDYGFEGTALNRKMMDFEAKKDGLDNYTTPGDVYKVLLLLLKNKRYSNFLKSQEINTKLSLYLSENEEFEFYHKTGELLNTEHDAGRIIYGDRFIDAVVFVENAKSNMEAIEIHNKIGKILIEELKK